MDASAYSGDVTVNVGLDEVPVDPIAGDTGVDAASEADADADLEQLADQSNDNSQAATTTGSFSASPTFTGVAIVAGASIVGGQHDVEIAAGIEDVEVEVEQEQEDIEQSNDADQSGEVSAEAYSGYVDVLQRSGDLLTAGGTGIEAESRAEAEADLDQTAVQSNSNSQTATTSLSFTANPIFGTAGGDASAGTDEHPGRDHSSPRPPRQTAVLPFLRSTTSRSQPGSTTSRLSSRRSRRISTRRTRPSRGACTIRPWTR